MSPLLDNRAEIGEVTHAPVASGTNAVELHCGAPHPRAGRDTRREITLLGPDDERQPVIGQTGAREAVAVVTRRQRASPVERDLDIALAIDLAPVQRFELARPELSGECLPVLEGERPAVCR